MEKQSVSEIVIEELCSQELKRNAYFPFFSGVIRGAGELIFTREGFSVSIKHSNLAFMEKLRAIIAETYGITLDMDYSNMNLGYKRGYFYTLVIPANHATDLLERCCIVHNKYEFVETLPKKLLGSGLAKKSFLKGLFLACGFLKVPSSGDISEKTASGYTLTFSLNSDIVKEEIVKLITEEAMLEKETVRYKKSGNGIYIKSSEAICDVLTAIGSVKGVLTLHEIISERRMRNDINRATNFDLANIDKAVEAGSKQADAIARLMESGMYEQLTEGLRQMCLMRIKFPDIGLEALGKEFTPPLSKSCVNHRLRKIMEIAEGIKEN